MYYWSLRNRLKSISTHSGTSLIRTPLFPSKIDLIVSFRIINKVVYKNWYLVILAKLVYMYMKIPKGTNTEYFLEFESLIVLCANSQALDFMKILILLN